jgi:hypothetical protein
VVVRNPHGHRPGIALIEQLHRLDIRARIVGIPEYLVVIGKLAEISAN